MAKYIVVPLFAIVAVLVLLLPVKGQITTACSGSTLTTFTPCMNLLANSSYNGSSPTSDCCNSLKSLTSGGLDCLCLIATASVPFKLPFNRSLAISLPRACNMPSIPVQCKAAAAPVPAPGPISLAPAASPPQASSPSPRAGVPDAEAPVEETTPTLSPPPTTTTGAGGAPTSTVGTGSGTGRGTVNLTPQASSAVPLLLSAAPLFSAVAFLFLLISHQLLITTTSLFQIFCVFHF